MDIQTATAASPSRACDERPVAAAYAETAKQLQARVGMAIRRRRQLLGLSLSELAKVCGVSFQQVQKYELGVSRISAAQLWMISGQLQAPVEYFYQGLRSVEANRR